MQSRASSDRRWTTSRIGLWGLFDLESFGSALHPRITVRELMRRLPHAAVRTFAPYGHLHPTRFDAGEPAEPLGRWTPERLSRLAGELDCVIVGGGGVLPARDHLLAPLYGADPSELAELAPSRWFIEGLGPELESECPVLWHAVGLPVDPGPEDAARLTAAVAGRRYLSVRDEPSRERLEAAGVEQEIAVVPDPIVLLPSLFPPALLEKRLDYLRLMGWYPPEGAALIVQGDRELVRFAPSLAPALRRLAEQEDLSLVIAGTGPCHGDGEFAEALAGRLPGRTYRLPAEAGVEDLTACIAASSGFIGASLSGSMATFAYGKPLVMLNLAGRSKLEGFARQIGDLDCLVGKPMELPKAYWQATAMAPRTNLVTLLQARADAHFDRIAEIAESSAQQHREGSRGAWLDDRRIEELEQHLDALRRAHEVRGRRLLAERIAFADHVQSLRLEVTNLRQQVRRLRAELDRMQEEAAEVLRSARDEAGARLKAEAELRAILNTRTFRYTAAARGVYGRIRRWARP